MEYAVTADHHRVHALDAEKGQEYYCPVCGNQVIPRQGEVNSWHFADFNSARTGIRLNGPIPQWVREDGGEAGLHPSNIHDNAYAVGTLDLTGLP